MLQNIVLETRMKIVTPARDPDVNVEQYKKDAPAHYAQLNTFMKGKKFLLGDKLCVMDFHMYDNLLFVHSFWGPEFLIATFPGLYAYVRRMSDLPAIKAYHQSDKYRADYPFTMRWMKVSPLPKLPKAPEYIVRYFPIHGRAECIMFLLAHAKADFVKEPVTDFA